MTPAELKAALKEAGLRQNAFAEMTGVSVPSVHRWCNGIRPVPKWVEVLLPLLAEHLASQDLVEAATLILDRWATSDKEPVVLRD